MKAGKGRIFNRPKYEDVIDLLRSCRLPTSDLNPQQMTDFIGIYQKERLIGVCGIEFFNGCALLRSLAVRPENRSNGQGKRLLETILARAVEREVAEIYLLTETARDYFNRQGFNTVQRADAPVEIRKSSQFLKICPLSSILMVYRVDENKQHRR